MQTEVALNGRTDPAANYLTWTPVQSQVRLVDASGATAPVAVKLRNKDTQHGGQVAFFTAPTSAPQNELQLTLPTDGSPRPFLVAGEFLRPSTAERDAAIEVVTVPGNEVLSTTPLMVRIRKDANTLTDDERDRFRSAIARLNDPLAGIYKDYYNIHRDKGIAQAHGNAGFLPWHRAFLLDLERELQRLDPSLALPYWRFDRPAPRVFQLDFMGVAGSGGNVQFSASNPLQSWRVDGGVLGFARGPSFDTQNDPAPVLNQAGTIGDPKQPNNPLGRYAQFRRMEGNPHGFAHTSFGGAIADIETAAQDPLFFLLHCNVDRLWARWQWLYGRFDGTKSEAYQFTGAAGDPGSTEIGHNLKDTMWPWNQVTGDPRPPTAPGGNFPPSPIISAPGLTPAVSAMIDYQGLLVPADRVAFDYDDVPFQP